MKKGTIFRRLFLTYGITIIIGFGILALLLMQLFNQYFIESKKQVLIEQGQKISQEIVLGLYTGQIDQQRLTDNLKTLDNLLNARIWLVDDSGYIIGVSGTSEDHFLGQQIEEAQLTQLYKGKNYFQIGNFGGKLEEKSLTAGYPIFVGLVFKGGLFIHAPLPEVQKTFRDIYAITVGAILLAGLLAYILLYFQIRRISKPLGEIGAAAREIAGGEFHKRLSIKTGDEIEELANSFNDMAESLERIEENRRNLVANISHDIRSPITSISGFAAGILDGTIPEEKQTLYLNKVLSESKRLGKITNDLLELSNMQQGQMSAEKQVFELNEIIRRAIVSFEQQIMAKNLQIELHVFDEAIYVYSDSVLLERILVNLLDNAVKFTPANGHILIQTSDQAGKILVELFNDGVAIEQEEIKRIWDRFHKGDASRGEHRSGFGLGLAIVREIIGLLGERIWAESGSDFVKVTFTLDKAKNLEAIK